MLTFLNTLFHSGELRISRSDAHFESRSINDALIHFESIWRNQLPATLPKFVPDMASRASHVLFLLARAVVFREIEMEQTVSLIRKCGLTTSDLPEDHYSVDLVFQFLPQVTERAARISESDPLIDQLLSIGRQWPLSSVGMKSCAPDEIPLALQHPTLWKIYTDRIISRKDLSRVNLPVVRDAVAAAIGPFANLAPEISNGLQPRAEALND